MSYHPPILDSQMQKVFDAKLPKVKDSTPEKLEMLASYANCLVNMARAQSDPARAAVWRRGVQYCSNGLFGKQKYINFGALLLDDQTGEVIYHLKESWELPMPDDYLTNDDYD